MENSTTPPQHRPNNNPVNTIDITNTTLSTPQSVIDLTEMDTSICVYDVNRGNDIPDSIVTIIDMVTCTISCQLIKYSWLAPDMHKYEKYMIEQ